MYWHWEVIKIIISEISAFVLCFIYILIVNIKKRFSGSPCYCSIRIGYTNEDNFNTAWSFVKLCAIDNCICFFYLSTTETRCKSFIIFTVFVDRICSSRPGWMLAKSGCCKMWRPQLEGNFSCQSLCHLLWLITLVLSHIDSAFDQLFTWEKSWMSQASLWLLCRVA